MDTLWSLIYVLRRCGVLCGYLGWIGFSINLLVVLNTIDGNFFRLKSDWVKEYCFIGSPKKDFSVWSWVLRLDNSFLKSFSSVGIVCVRYSGKSL